MKKIVLFILLMLPVVVLASDVEHRSVGAFWDIWYNKTTKEVEIIGIRSYSSVSWFEEDLRKESSRKYWKEGSLIIPATVKVGNDECKVVGICDEAFFYNSIYSINIHGVVIGENVRYIGKSAFRNQELYKIEIQGNSLEEIKSYAFYSSELSIEKLELPSSIKRIGAYAFSGGPNTPNSGVKDIYCYAADPPKCGSSAFYVYKNFDGKRCCYAPKESIDKYKDILYNYFFYFIPLPETVGIDDKKMSVSESDNHRVICQGNTIIISGTTIGDPVSIYNLAGQRLYTSVCDKGTTAISIPFFDRNLVIIKVGKKTIKCNLK